MLTRPNRLYKRFELSDGNLVLFSRPQSAILIQLVWARVEVHFVFVSTAGSGFACIYEAFSEKKYSGDQKQEKVAKTSNNSGSCTAFSISSVPVSASASTPGGEERPLSVKSLLKQKIQGKLNTVQEFDDSSCRERKQLEEWCGNLESLGFVCELISLSDRHSPFLHEEKNSIPESALVVHASRDHTYSSKTCHFFRWFLAFAVYYLWISGCNKRDTVFPRL